MLKFCTDWCTPSVQNQNNVTLRGIISKKPELDQYICYANIYNRGHKEANFLKCIKGQRSNGPHRLRIIEQKRPILAAAIHQPNIIYL